MPSSLKPAGTQQPLGWFHTQSVRLLFARGVQRLFARTWELRALSVRNTVNDLLWIGGLFAYMVISGVVHREVGHSRIRSGQIWF